MTEKKTKEESTSLVESVNKEINLEVANEHVQTALLSTTFKGLDFVTMKRAMLEGMLRGFKFKDFLEKNVYAIPFKDNRSGAVGYSLVTSIDFSRKIGMRSGVVGKSAPSYTYTDGVNGKKAIESCSVTIKRKVGDYIGDYTATVYMDEYDGKRNQWLTKPRTMIAKVAEMHALRMACPEELAKAYIEEELEKSAKIAPEVNLSEYEAKLRAVTSADELKTVWASLPIQAKQGLEEIKNELKKKYDTKKIPK